MTCLFKKGYTIGELFSTGLCLAASGGHGCIFRSRKAISHFAGMGIKAWDIGLIVKGDKGVQIEE